MVESSFEKSKDIAKVMISEELTQHDDPELIQLFENIYEWQRVGGLKLVEKQIETILNEIMEEGAVDDQIES